MIKTATRMKLSKSHFGIGALLWMASLNVVFADEIVVENCDLTEFRWLCEIPVHYKYSNAAPSLIDCGGTNVYVTREQYETIARYQRASVNMTLKVNGEYITSPCVPAGYHAKWG